MSSKHAELSRISYSVFLVPYDECVPREMGPTAEAVSANLKHLLAARRLSARSFAATMPAGPGQLTHSAVSEIARGVRRVDVDELTALAAALGVSPATLLLPPPGPDPISGQTEEELPQRPAALTGVDPIPADELLRWLQGWRPLPPPTPYRDAVEAEFQMEVFRRQSLPWWAWEWYRERED